MLREKLAPVTAVCLACFREHVHNALSGSVISAILEQLAEFRANAPVSFSVLSDAVHVFMSVADNGSVYYDDLEPVLLRSASSFYDSEFVNRLLSSGNASSYLHAVAAILSKELDNAKLWLPDDSVDRLRGLLHERLLAQTFSSLLGGSGFSQMLLEGNTRGSSTCYPPVSAMADCVVRHCPRVRPVRQRCSLCRGTRHEVYGLCRGEGETARSAIRNCCQAD